MIENGKNKVERSLFEFIKGEWKFFRDIILFFGGLGGVFFMLIDSGPNDPTLLLIFGAMMGLPAFLRSDEKDKDGK